MQPKYGVWVNPGEEKYIMTFLLQVQNAKTGIATI